MEESVAGVRTEPLQTERAAALAQRITGNLRHVMHAPDETLDLCVLCLFAEGHLIIEDLPGVGKTTLAKALARSLDLSFSRIQFTPDLLPSDVTGVNVYNQASQEFEFRPGPVFANVLLVDEINRTSPKTQAALLEVMQERQVTIDGVTYPLDPPFIVMATQNPIEYEGTYPLPEAQLDRFTMRISIGYPPLAAEAQMLTEQTTEHPLEELTAVAGAEDVLTAIADAQRVYVEESVQRYVVGLLHTHARRQQALPRRQPACRHQPASRREGAGARRAARLPDSRRREGGGADGALAPAHPRARGARERPLGRRRRARSRREHLGPGLGRGSLC